MTQLSIDGSHKWDCLENRIPGAQEAIEEVYLVLRLMGASPNMRMGRKTSYERRRNKTSYRKYTFYTENILQFAIHVFDHDTDCRIKFNSKSLQTEFIYFNTIEDLRSHLNDWLIDF